MIVRGIDHIGIAVPSLASAERPYAGLLGLPWTHEEAVAEQGVKARVHPVGGGMLELLEPLGPDGPVGRFLARRGPGLHHVALEVEDLDGALVELEARGVRLLDASPRRGIAGTRIAFVHPRALGGVLLELVERPR